jgi:hypothetical protein
MKVNFKIYAEKGGKKMKSRKTTYFKYFSLFFTIAILVFIAGCSGTPPAVPIINSFSASPTTITAGESSTLSWSVTDAASVTIDNGVGTVALSGNTTVSPITTTTYTLTATNTAGSVTSTVTVTVEWEEVHQWASTATASSEYSSISWSAAQATGEPDVTACGDYSGAWAPSSSGDDPEWLQVGFETAVYATGVRVHETYYSGFVIRIELVDTEGLVHTIWTGIDITPCPGWLEIGFSSTSYLVEGVIISTQIDGWEEIDAVELIGYPQVL